MATVPQTFISDLSVGGFAPGKQPAYSDLFVYAGTSGEEALRGDLLVVVKLIEQGSWSYNEENQNLASTFWRRLWGPEQKVSVDSKKEGVKQVKSDGDRRK